MRGVSLPAPLRLSALPKKPKPSGEHVERANEAGPSKTVARSKSWKIANPERYKAYCREYYHRNKGRIDQKHRERYMPHPPGEANQYTPHIVYRYKGEPPPPSQRVYTSCRACAGLPHRRPGRGACNCGHYSQEANPYADE